MSTKRDEPLDEDFLDTDKSIPGQSYVCMSFVSPDKVLTKKVSRKKVEKKEPVDVKKVKKEEKWIGPKMPRKAVTRKTL